MTFSPFTAGKIDVTPESLDQHFRQRLQYCLHTFWKIEDFRMTLEVHLLFAVIRAGGMLLYALQGVIF